MDQRVTISHAARSLTHSPRGDCTLCTLAHSSAGSQRSPPSASATCSSPFRTNARRSFNLNTSASRLSRSRTTPAAPKTPSAIPATARASWFAPTHKSWTYPTRVAPRAALVVVGRVALVVRRCVETPHSEATSEIRGATLRRGQIPRPHSCLTHPPTISAPSSRKVGLCRRPRARERRRVQRRVWIIPGVSASPCATYR